MYNNRPLQHLTTMELYETFLEQNIRLYNCRNKSKNIEVNKCNRLICKIEGGNCRTVTIALFYIRQGIKLLLRLSILKGDSGTSICI